MVAQRLWIARITIRTESVCKSDGVLSRDRIVVSGIKHFCIAVDIAGVNESQDSVDTRDRERSPLAYFVSQLRCGRIAVSGTTHGQDGLARHVRTLKPRQRHSQRARNPGSR